MFADSLRAGSCRVLFQK